MLVFAIISNSENPALEGRINDEYALANFRFAKNVWLVADRGITAKEVCEKLDIEPGGINGAIVINVEKYFGFAPKTTWDWLQVKMNEG